MLIVVMWPNQFALSLIFCQFLVIFIGLRLHLADSNFWKQRILWALDGIKFPPYWPMVKQGKFFPDIGKKPNNQYLFILYQ